jgi:predicted nuclease of predicted toxin-antitoxin system
MNLLFDHNLSPRLVNRLADVFPGSSHVFLLGLAQASDNEIWNYARDNDFVLVTKDADFGDLVVLRGFPPKVLWLRLGNCTTGQVEALIRVHAAAIQQFIADQAVGILSLS